MGNNSLLKPAPIINKAALFGDPSQLESILGKEGQVNNMRFSYWWRYPHNIMSVEILSTATRKMLTDHMSAQGPLSTTAAIDIPC